MTGKRRRGAVPLALVLAGGFGTVLVVAVLAVLAVGLRNLGQTALDLLSERARIAVSTSVARLEQHLRPAADQLEAIGDMIASGALDPGDRTRLGAVLTGALASAPQIRTLVFAGPDHLYFGAERAGGAIRLHEADRSASRAARREVAAARRPGPASWGRPGWSPAHRTTLLRLRRPLHREGRFVGLLAAAISIRELSEQIAELAEELGDNAFILHDRRSVLAHALLLDGYPGLSASKPLPDVAGFSDPVLASIWQAPRQPVGAALPAGTEGVALDLFGERYVFLYRDVTGLGDRPWQVGAYFRAAELAEYFDLWWWTAAVGGGALAAALAVALVLSRRIARPIARFAEAAGRVGRLELADLPELPPSRLRELDDQASAFNAMLGGLRWFEVYVPKTLVRRLIRQGGGREPPWAEREVTVMFTDMAGFTRIAEGADAERLARFLNHHFAIVAGAVEAEGGTVDKFVGDAVMAFWGAPEDQPDHAVRACRAALAIRAAVRADNGRRRAAGEEPVRVRVGLHSGPAVVGNIGAPGRMNYTMVGDTVNVAQRLEQLAKRAGDASGEVAIVASAATAAGLGSGFALEAAGEFRVPGRERRVKAFRLS